MNDPYPDVNQDEILEYVTTNPVKVYRAIDSITYMPTIIVVKMDKSEWLLNVEKLRHDVFEALEKIMWDSSFETYKKEYNRLYEEGKAKGWLNDDIILSNT